MTRLKISTCTMMAAITICAFAALMLAQAAEAAKIKPPPPKVVFVSSTIHNGNFGGRSGADAICNARAAEAGLPGAGNYLAWLSDDILSVNDRFTRGFNNNYVLADGFVIVGDWDDLVDVQFNSDW